MVYYSGINLDKRLKSNTTTFSSESNLVNEVLRSLNGEFGKHPGIAKTMFGYSEKYYFPKMAQIIRQWVMSCEQFIRA